MNEKGMNRRDLLRAAGLASAGLAAAQAAPQQAAGKSVSGMPFEPKETVRLGLIGVGGRGNSHIDEFSASPTSR